MKSRRGIASVVGMVFAIIALTTTIAYISYSMGILNNYNQSVLVQNQQLTDVDKEKFQISSVTVPDGKLNITVANTGSLPIQFTKLWIQNTSATDWVNSYVPTNNFVSTGGVLTDIGQNIPASINPLYSYNVKMVTSRGNTQQFTMNSASAQPLNIQLMFFPATVAGGFNTTLTMIVTNNSTSTLTNITPSPLPSPTYTGSGTTLCTASAVNPSKYTMLAPGSTAVFTWNVKVSGSGGDTCTFKLTKPLQNGYSQTIQATATITVIQLSSSNYAVYAGTLTMNYTQFQYTEGGSWNTGWQIPGGYDPAFSLKITNNNATSDFYISQQSFFWLQDVSQGTPASNQYYIVNSVSLTSPPTLSSYNPDYGVKVPHGGGTVQVYFGASSAGGSTYISKSPLQSNHGYSAFLLLFGKFVNSQSENTIQYGQNIPFVGILAT
ncbi:MAG: hypothetical protein KGI25_03165 [Thaumarchaeota archaeon]|nr:hypothetical protein [Nitrososphaerota archaeon]